MTAYIIVSVLAVLGLVAWFLIARNLDDDAYELGYENGFESGYEFGGGNDR